MMGNGSLKKSISVSTIVLLVFLLAFHGLLINVGSVYAAADVTKPTFKSVEVDKTDAVAGDTVKVSVGAEDVESGIDRVTVWYFTPITKKSKYITLNYNANTQKYEGFMEITEKSETGLWEIWHVNILDHAGNELAQYNSNVTSSKGAIDLSSGNFEVSGTTADVTKPTFKSVEVDKTEAVAGDEINISVKAEDAESGIDRITVWYFMPITKKSKYITLNYNANTQKYEGFMKITEKSETGLWEIWHVNILDHAGNELAQYNSNVTSLKGAIDLSSGNFEVRGTTADVTKPTFKSVEVDKTEAVAGDEINISVKAEDAESGIDRITVWYFMPITKKSKYITLNYNANTQKYEGFMKITEKSETGLWEIWHVNILDHAGNELAQYNSNVTSLKGAIDLSNGNFTVKEDDNPIKPLNQTVVTQNERWTSKTVEGDLYIGPEAVLTVNGQVTVNGDIYVLGALVSYGAFNVNGTIHANRFIWGSSNSLSHGTVNIRGGTNNIRGQHASNRPLNDIPFEVYTNPIISENGKISKIEGATLPIVNMSVEGKAVQLKYNGTFSVNNLDVGNKADIKFNFIDVFGNIITKIVPIKIVDTIPPTAKVDIKSGYYGKPKEITISMSEAGNVYYTQDGSTPTVKSLQYKGPINISKDTVLKFFAVDKAGNKSEIYTEEYLFFTVDEITDKSKVVTGKAQPNSIVKVSNGQFVWEAKADKQGNYQMEIPVQPGNKVLTVFAIDEKGTESEKVKVTVKDTTAPEKPSVNEVTDQSREVTGTAEAGTTVIVKADGKELGRAVSDGKGAFTVDIPVQEADTELQVTATDRSGNESSAAKIIVKDVTPPAKPMVNEITDQSKEVAGKAEAGTTVIVKAEGRELGRSIANAKGAFTVNIPAQKAGLELQVTAKDKAGNESSETIVIVKDVTPPAKPVVNEVTDKSKEVTGKAEASSTIIVKAKEKEIGRSSADAKGAFTVSIPVQKAESELQVTATDKAGNISEANVIVVKDITPPKKPVVDEVSDLSKEVTGKAEVESIISVKVNDTEIGNGKVKADGTFKVVIPQQKPYTRLSVTAADKAGNVSETANVEVKAGELTEESISMLVQIKAGKSYIYSDIITKEDRSPSDNYKNSVYYVKKQASYNDELYFLLSNRPSATSGIIGWMKASDVTAHSHRGVDNKAKTFYVKGTGGVSYNRAWGGRKNIIYNDLKLLKNTVFKVNKTEKVGKNTWYRGVLNGKQTWIHSNHLSKSRVKYVEKSTSRLAQIKAGQSFIYSTPGTTLDRKNSINYKNKVYFIKRQVQYNGELYYLLSDQPSASRGIIGWMKASDLTSHAHTAVDNKSKTLYVKGTGGVSYNRAWGSKKNIIHKDLKKVKNAKFKVNKTEKVGRNIWYRGILNGKQTWIHSSHLKK